MSKRNGKMKYLAIGATAGAEGKYHDPGISNRIQYGEQCGGGK